MQQPEPRSKALPPWSLPAALLILSALAYGLSLPSLGFYWDDWPFAWKRLYMGTPGLIAEFARNRPLRGYFEPLLTPFLGVNPLAWQLFALAARSATAILFWYFLRALWKGRDLEAFLAAAIFLIYPGFTQQALAATYAYFWVFYALLFLSLLLMLRAVRSQRFSWPLYLVALLFSGLQLFASEYMVAAELFRPVFLWVALAPLLPETRPRLRRVLLLWLPFLLVLAIYVLWRLFLYKTPMYSIDYSLSTLTGLPAGTLRALYDVNVGAWLHAMHWPDFAQYGILHLAGYALAAFGLLAVGPWLGARFERECRPHSGLAWMAIGITGMSLAALPFLASGLPFRLVFPEDRFAISFLPFAGMFWAGLLGLIPIRPVRLFVYGLLLMLAFNQQFKVMSDFRRDWRSQKSYAWQLAWRLPRLAPGTHLLSEDYESFPYNDDEALAALLNWTYIPTGTQLPYNYGYAFISMQLSKELPGMLENTPPGASNLVVTRYAPPACLHVLDPTFDTVVFGLPRRYDFASFTSQALPVLPEWTVRALPLSNPSLAASGNFPAAPPDFMGPEPAHDWCYFYLKADLARQQGDWAKVAELGDEAAAQGLVPDDGYEYLPFIEGYARQGRLKEARLLTRQAALDNDLLRPALCGAWERLVDAAPQSAADMRQELAVCPLETTGDR